MGPENATEIRPAISNPGSALQALAFWRWGHMMRTAAPPDKKIVVLNLDETPLRLLPRKPVGALTRSARCRLRSGRVVRDSATKREERGSLTQVVVVADDDEINAALPTIILGSERMLTRKRWQRLAGRMPGAVALWREGRGWITAKSMCAVIRSIARALQPFRHSCRFVLSADAYRAHMSPSVWTAAKAAGFGYMIIPARMTWALQVCDTHVFSPYKAAISAEYQKRLSTADSHPHGEDRWDVLMDSIVSAWEQRVRRRSWRSAFASTGNHAGLRGISTRLLSALELSEVPDAEEFPGLEDFSEIFPNGADIPLEQIFRVLYEPPSNSKNTPRAAAALRPRSAGFEPGALGPPNPRWSRTATGSAVAARPAPRMPRGTYFSPAPPGRMGPRTRSQKLLGDP
jgi:hypothetical protein